MKKKGLLISTIIMVVVLVASLTTATYAWFSATANVTVENLSVTTQATKGLEIAVKTTKASVVLANSGYVTGEIGFDTASGYFTEGTGAVGWSDKVDFSSLTDTNGSGTIGIWNKAVGYVTQSGTKFYVNGTSEEVTNKIYAEKTGLVSGTSSVSGYYTTGETTMVAGSGTYHGEATTYYEQKTASGYINNGDYITPVGYYTNSSNILVPIGYEKAVSNVDYMVLPISVRPTTVVDAIICKITFSATEAGMNEASRLIIKSAYGTEVLEPTFTNNKWEYKFVVSKAASSTSIAKNTIFDLTYIIWLEGTDSDCNNDHTGTGFDIDIAYDFVEDGDAAPTIPEGYISNNASMNNTASAKLA